MGGVGLPSAATQSPSGSLVSPHKDSSDFLLEEYSQIAQAFFSLYAQLNQMLQTYLTVMTAGSAAVTFLLQILPKLYPTVGSANDLTVLGALLTFLSFLGVMAFFALIGIRSEMLLYARTINRVRAYFKDKDPTSLPGYLVLPTTTQQPGFYEGRETYFFWEALFVGAINSVIFAAGVFLLLAKPIDVEWSIVFAAIAVAGAIAHWGAYRIFAWAKENAFARVYGGASTSTEPRSQAPGQS